MGGVIKTAVELCDLPVGAVVTDRSGRAWQKSTMPHCCWRSYDVLPLCDEGMLRGQRNGVTLVYDPTAQANADARLEALSVARDMLAAELGLSHDTDGIAQMIIAALVDDGLIHHSPVPWDFTPGCSLRVHGPGMIPAADLDAVPPGSAVITESMHIWTKEKDGWWQRQGDQAFGEPTVIDRDPTWEPKEAPALTKEGPMVLISTEWEA